MKTLDRKKEWSPSSNHDDHLVFPLPRCDPNQIKCVGFSLKEDQRQSVIRVIEDWISRQQRLLFLPKESTYRLTLEKHGSEQYSAVLQVQVSSKRWFGSATGSDPVRALLFAVAELTSTYRHFDERNIGSDLLFSMEENSIAC